MLEVQNLCIAYGSEEAVKGVSFAVEQGQIVGIVGESGSGKSTILRSILGILNGEGHVTSGKILYDDKDLTDCSARDWRDIRGRKISMIFQHPAASLDPIMRIGDQFCESMKTMQHLNRKEASAKAKVLLGNLHLDDPERIMRSYPFELSGGMCQRAAIALAIANGSELLLADEPTSALDVTVQPQTIQTMMELRDNYHTAILLVTHNMGVVAHMADMVGVMHNGVLVEWGTKEQVLYHPVHDYTKRLIRAIPKLETGD